MAFSYCFFAAEAYICRGSLSWATGHLQTFLGCFPQGWGCGWEKHCRCCPSHPRQAGDLPPRQPSCRRGCSQLCCGSPASHALSWLAACSAGRDFYLASRYIPGFSLSLPLFWAGASEKMEQCFSLPPLQLLLSD